MSELDYKNIEAKCYGAVDWLQQTDIDLTNRDSMYSIIRAVAEYAYNINTRSNWISVEMSTMIEAGKERYFVRLIHPDRPKDAMPWDEGYMDVFATFIKEHAEQEKERWENFFKPLPSPPGDSR